MNQQLTRSVLQMTIYKYLMIIKIIEDSITELAFRIALFTFNEDKYRIT